MTENKKPNEDLIFKLNRLITLYNYNTDSKDFFRKKVFINLINLIKKLDEPLSDVNKVEFLKQKGIGPKSKDVINEYIKTGTISKLTKLEERVKPFLKKQDVILLFKTVHGIGDAIAEQLYQKGYRTIEDLKKHESELTHAQQLGLKYRDDFNIRIPRKEIDAVHCGLEAVFEYISETYNIPKITFEIVGSYRRGALTSGDIDILVKGGGKITVELIVETLKEFKIDDDNPFIIGTLAQGNSKFMGIIRCSQKLPARRLDIFVSKPEEWATYLLYGTGSGNFNVSMRTYAETKGFRINEKFVKDITTGFEYQPLKEEDIFKLIGMKYVKPEDRI